MLPIVQLIITIKYEFYILLQKVYFIISKENQQLPSMILLQNVLGSQDNWWDKISNRATKKQIYPDLNSIKYQDNISGRFRPFQRKKYLHVHCRFIWNNVFQIRALPFGLADHHDNTVSGTQGIQQKKTRTVANRKITKRLQWQIKHQCKLNIEQHEPLVKPWASTHVFSSLIPLRNRYFFKLWFLISCVKISDLLGELFRTDFVGVLLPRMHFFHCKDFFPGHSSSLSSEYTSRSCRLYIDPLQNYIDILWNHVCLTRFRGTHSNSTTHT